MSIVALMMTANTVIGMTERWRSITGPDPAAYAQALWDNEVKQDAKATGQRCESPVITSLSFKKVTWTEMFWKYSGSSISYDGGGYQGFRRSISRGKELFPKERHGVIEHLRIEACGRTRIANVFVAREFDRQTGKEFGDWEFEGLLDGESYAEPKLQDDALAVAMINLVEQAKSAHPENCSTQSAISTLRMGPSVVLKPRVDKTWTELWSAGVCGASYAVKVEFSPNPKGPGVKFDIAPAPLDTKPDASSKP